MSSREQAKVKCPPMFQLCSSGILAAGQFHLLGLILEVLAVIETIGGIQYWTASRRSIFRVRTTAARLQAGSP